jgi:hypothetical protein
MGLAKPPVVQLTPAEVLASCTAPDPARHQVSLHTASKKWVYANVESDTPWIRVLTPQVAGPQQAAIAFEVDSRQVPRGRPAEGALQVSANGGQNLTLRVRAQLLGGGASLTGRLLRPVLVGALGFLLLRLLLAPVLDGLARQVATVEAASRAGLPVPDGYGNWLALPWVQLYFAGGELGPGAADFRTYFTGYFIFIVTLCTFWLGAVGGAWALWRRGGGLLSVPWGLVAGAVGGLAAAATLACLVLAGDLLPHALWALAALPAGPAGVALWIPLAVVCWTLVGAGVGALLGLTGPLGRPFLEPLGGVVAAVFRTVGLRGPAAYFAG